MSRNQHEINEIFVCYNSFFSSFSSDSDTWLFVCLLPLAWNFSLSTHQTMFNCSKAFASFQQLIHIFFFSEVCVHSNTPGNTELNLKFFLHFCQNSKHRRCLIVQLNNIIKNDWFSVCRQKLLCLKLMKNVLISRYNVIFSFYLLVLSIQKAESNSLVWNRNGSVHARQ